MILRVILLFILAAPPLIEALNVPVVCPCTFVINRSIKVAKRVLKNGNECCSNNCSCCSLPPQDCKETYETYIQRVFTQQKDEPCNDYYTRVFKSYKNESDQRYVERIDKIFAVFPKLARMAHIKFWTYLEKYYLLKYGRLEKFIPLLKETRDQYFSRILRREKNEDFDTFIKRMDCIFKAYPKLDIWRRIKFDSDSRNWYFYRHVAYNSAIRPSENIRESIVTQYGKRDSEKNDDISYFKRITTRLQGESDEDYIDRLNRIRSRYGNLPLWTDCEYLDLTKEYYKLLYAKKENENFNDYYKRLTTKSTSEDFPTYVKRLCILQKVFCDLPLWNNSDFLEFTAPFYNWLYAKKPEEDKDTYLKRITCRSPSETQENYLKRLDICRWVNRENGLFYNCAVTPIKNYYKNFFKKRKCDDDVDKWLARIFKRNFGENDSEYVKRLVLVLKLLNRISEIDLSEVLLKHVSEFWRLLYKRATNEDRESWLKRVTERLPVENDVTYQTRLRYLENIYTDCRSFVGGVLSRLFGPAPSTCSKNKEVEVLLVKKKEKTTKKKECKKNKQTVEKTSKKTPEDEIEEIYGKKPNEDESAWFKRLTQKSKDESPDQYVKTLNIVRKYFPSLPLWYNKKYFDLVKEYYTCLYKKLGDEPDEKYFERLVTKESWESWDQFGERVALVRSLYPNLPLWTAEKYYDQFTKKVFEAECKKKSTESIEEYVQRLLTKEPLVDTSPELWAKRIHLIQRATASSPIWFDDKCYPFTKSFFQVFYKKDEKEGCDAWLTRVLKPLTGESEENSIKRVRLIKQTTGDCGCWTEFTFKKVASSKCLSSEYLEDIENKFFDSATTYERIYSSSKKSAKSESSSSSEEQVKVVKKS